MVRESSRTLEGTGRSGARTVGYELVRIRDLSRSCHVADKNFFFFLEKKRKMHPFWVPGRGVHIQPTSVTPGPIIESPPHRLGEAFRRARRGRARRERAPRRRPCLLRREPSALSSTGSPSPPSRATH